MDYFSTLLCTLGGGSGGGGSPWPWKVMFLLFMVVVAAAAKPEEEEAAAAEPGFSCPVVIKSISSCDSFLSVGSNIRPSVACCAAAKRLDYKAKQSSASDRKDLCFCLSILGQDSIPSHAFAFKNLCKLNIVKIGPENQC